MINYIQHTPSIGRAEIHFIRWTMFTEDNLFLNELILELADNNTKALEEIYRIMGARMKGIALKSLKTKYYADDVVSEAFFKIVKKANTFKKGTNGISWICRIVRNTAYDYNKLEIRYPKIRFDIVDDNMTVTDKREDAEIRECLENALRKLSSIEYRVITLHYWEYMTIREISREIKKPKSTVYFILEKAKENLRKYLSESM